MELGGLPVTAGGLAIPENRPEIEGVLPPLVPVLSYLNHRISDFLDMNFDLFIYIYNF